MTSPLHREVGPEIVTGAGAGSTVMESVCGVPAFPHVLDGVTVKVYVPAAAVPQFTPMVEEEAVPFGVVKDAPAGRPLQV